MKKIILEIVYSPMASSQEEILTAIGRAACNSKVKILKGENDPEPKPEHPHGEGEE